MRILTAAFAITGICILAVGCGSGSDQAGKTSTTTRTTTKAAPTLAEDSLKGLLLTPEQINAVMGATDMTITKYHVAMADDSATMQPKQCLAVDGAAQSQVYAGSGFIAVRDQTLQEGDNFNHFAEQALVLFSSAKQAGAFFAASAKQWSKCEHYKHIQSGTEWNTGPVSNKNGVLSVIASQQNPKAGGWACGRALAARNNVVIDVNTCSANPGHTAVDIVNQIAAKVRM
ncbi:sensor domain-containing protein [Mycobacterium fragae]|uniref:PknH-like extracellular domain-containing protein n=1 Tax=Mycobacterium fragae TaxID=1260918 RepID=A0A1X1UJE9_9MYCO|nr:sensor domain-containing protein [Mycobacterium fragae]MCV7401145.1 sensor domain-containing protein [Mycobacterium fragae]ORV56911.1 hypothetical protein AWC06_01550 [Mycobacterium fragae]